MKILKIFLSLFAAGLFGCSMFNGIEGQSQQELRQKDCSLIFPRTNDCVQKKGENGQLYLEAWDRASEVGLDDLLGYVFQRTILHEGDSVRLLVGFRESGKIFSVKILSPHPINQEFLLQFVGRSFGDSFEIAQSIDDLLYVPTKIKPMREDVLTSKAIANSVGEVVKTAYSLLSKR